MNAQRYKILVNVKLALERMLTKAQDMRMDICVLQTYIEQELKKGDD